MNQTKDLREGVWCTPREFFEPLRKEFDLEIDVAASLENSMLPKCFTKEIDGLKQNWKGLRVWCNPPYGRGIYEWVKKCYIGRAKIVVALLPARTDTRWFHEFIYNNPWAEIRFMKGRIKFSGSSQCGKFPSMVVIFKQPNSQ